MTNKEIESIIEKVIEKLLPKFMELIETANMVEKDRKEKEELAEARKATTERRDEEIKEKTPLASSENIFSERKSTSQYLTATGLITMPDLLTFVNAHDISAVHVNTREGRKTANAVYQIGRELTDHMMHATQTEFVYAFHTIKEVSNITATSSDGVTTPVVKRKIHIAQDIETKETIAKVNSVPSLIAKLHGKKTIQEFVEDHGTETLPIHEGVYQMVQTDIAYFLDSEIEITLNELKAGSKLNPDIDTPVDVTSALINTLESSLEVNGESITYIDELTSKRYALQYATPEVKKEVGAAVIKSTESRLRRIGELPEDTLLPTTLISISFIPKEEIVDGFTITRSHTYSVGAPKEYHVTPTIKSVVFNNNGGLIILGDPSRKYYGVDFSNITRIPVHATENDITVAVHEYVGYNGERLKRVIPEDKFTENGIYTTFKDACESHGSSESLEKLKYETEKDKYRNNKDISDNALEVSKNSLIISTQELQDKLSGYKLEISDLKRDIAILKKDSAREVNEYKQELTKAKNRFKKLKEDALSGTFAKVASAVSNYDKGAGAAIDAAGRIIDEARRTHVDLHEVPEKEIEIPESVVVDSKDTFVFGKTVAEIIADKDSLTAAQLATLSGEQREVIGQALFLDKTTHVHKGPILNGHSMFERVNISLYFFGTDKDRLEQTVKQSNDIAVYEDDTQEVIDYKEFWWRIWISDYLGVEKDDIIPNRPAFDVLDKACADEAAEKAAKEKQAEEEAEATSKAKEEAGLKAENDAAQKRYEEELAEKANEINYKPKDVAYVRGVYVYGGDDEPIMVRDYTDNINGKNVDTGMYRYDIDENGALIAWPQGKYEDRVVVDMETSCPTMEDTYINIRNYYRKEAEEKERAAVDAVNANNRRKEEAASRINQREEYSRRDTGRNNSMQYQGSGDNDRQPQARYDPHMPLCDIPAELLEPEIPRHMEELLYRGYTPYEISVGMHLRR